MENSVNKLIEDNMGLAYVIAKKYKASKQFDYDDLVQYGMVGLCHAANNFVGKKGKFKNYASVCIEGTILRAMRDYSGRIGSSEDRASGKAITPILFTDHSYTIKAEEDENGRDPVDLICENTYDLESEVTENMYFEDYLLEGFTEPEKNLARVFAEGYRITEGSRKIGISCQYACYVKGRIMKKLKAKGVTV